ncbi:MAG: hypothetical protein Q4C20_01125 [Erysipelotrichaceae bacterium]|nr:hypothetical protein [Erysipelotrichaceae bacterium]
MIDIHTHILFGIDDGSKSLEMSLKMAKMAYESGVDTIVATPHCMPGMYNNYAGEKLQNRFDLLKQAIYDYGIPVHLRKGMEVLVTEKIEKLLDENKLWTLNGTHYLLVEFSFDEDPVFCRDSLKKIKEKGYIPVVAHPCRYYFVQRYPQIVYDWYQAGYGIQVNKGSILGMFGKKEQNCVHRLLRHRVVSCAASDAHRLDRRTPRMDEVRDLLYDRYGGEYSYMLLDENPKRILRDRSLVGYDPVSFEE